MHGKESAGFRTQVNMMNARLSAGPLGKQWILGKQESVRVKTKAVTEVNPSPPFERTTFSRENHVYLLLTRFEQSCNCTT